MGRVVLDESGYAARGAKVGKRLADVPDEAGGLFDRSGRSARAAHRLTAEQQRLVTENLGLVGVHIRRFVPFIEGPSRDREWYDLFQEGCLGLIKAAATYDRCGRGLRFQAYALRCIRTYVNRARLRGFETVHIPDTEVRAAARFGQRRRRVTVRSLGVEPAAHRATARHHSGGQRDGATIGARIRRKYDEAVGRAAADIRHSQGEVSRLGKVVDRLVEDRLLVPASEHRLSLRQVARLTRCPLTTVAHLEARLCRDVRAALCDDAELARLRAESRRAPDAMDASIDDSVCRRVAWATAEEFSKLFRAEPETRKAMIVLHLIKLHNLLVENVAMALFNRLADADRRAVVSEYFAARVWKARAS
jgi:hypothetical protein